MALYVHDQRCFDGKNETLSEDVTILPASRSNGSLPNLSADVTGKGVERRGWWAWLSVYRDSVGMGVAGKVRLCLYGGYALLSPL